MILSAEHKEIKEMASVFARAEVAPLAQKIDRDSEIPDSLIEKLKEMGFFGILIPEKYGGAGMDSLAYALIITEISSACASTGVLLSAHNSLVCYPVLKYGTESQKKRYLPGLARGNVIGCFCLSEPNAGSDAGSLQSTAEKKGDFFELNGGKNFITNGKEAKLAIVFAKTSKEKGNKGISAFLVNPQQVGFQIIKYEDKLGIRGSSTAQIALDKVKIGPEDLLGEEGQGFKIALDTLDGGRVGIAAQALGIGEAAFSYAGKYARERIQFGAPIADFQAIRFILADMSTKLEASRLLIQKASLEKDAGKRITKIAAQAKLFASESTMWITTKAIQVCGGNGYMKEFPLERNFRDAKICEIYEGTSEIQRLVVAHQELS